jgi:DNA-binding HxlR family transcriptional regulator
MSIFIKSLWPYAIGSDETMSTLLGVLSQSKAIEILLALLNGAKHIRFLHREVGGSISTVESRVKELINAKLVKEVGEGTARRRVLELTDAGRTLAIMLRRVMEGTTKVKVSENILEGPRKWILLLLYVLGTIKGSTRLEKLLFLLKEEFKVVDGPFYYFTPYLFGPFSAEALNDARLLRDAGLIEIVEEVFDFPLLSDWMVIRKTYRLTEAGKEVARYLFEELREKPEAREALRRIQQYNIMPLDQLLDYVYKNYPEFKREEV